MERRLFLTSGGIVPEIKNDFLEFLDKDPHKTTLAFVTTASDPLEDKTYFQTELELLRQTKVNITPINLKDHTPDTINQFSAYDLIYFSGGHPYYLLYWMKKSGFAEYAPHLLDQGIIYVGTSAGSIVASPDISLLGWQPGENHHGAILNDLAGLNLVNFYLSPHRDKYNLESLQRKKEGYPHPVIALTDRQAIMIRGGKQLFVGEGSPIWLR